MKIDWFLTIFFLDIPGNTFVDLEIILLTYSLELFRLSGVLEPLQLWYLNVLSVITLNTKDFSFYFRFIFRFSIRQSSYLESELPLGFVISVLFLFFVYSFVFCLFLSKTILFLIYSETKWNDWYDHICLHIGIPFWKNKLGHVFQVWRPQLVMYACYNHFYTHAWMSKGLISHKLSDLTT